MAKATKFRFNDLSESEQKEHSESFFELVSFIKKRI